MSYNPLSSVYYRKLDNLARLSGLMEVTLVAEAEELDARLAVEAQRYTEEERQDLYEYHAEDYYQLSDELPTLMRYSVLIGADSGLEVFLNNTCATFAQVHKAAVALSDFRGSGIERARNYLKKVAQVSFPDMVPEWTSVKRLHELRNAIVHADGYVPPDKSEVRQWSSKIPGLKISEVGEISLSQEFTGAALTTYREFVKRVDAACASLSLWYSVFPPIEDAT